MAQKIVPLEHQPSLPHAQLLLKEKPGDDAIPMPRSMISCVAWGRSGALPTI